IQIAAARPMLLILIALWHRPDLISPIIALAVAFAFQRNHFPLQQGIDIQKIVSAKRDLDQPTADLRNNLQLYPRIGQFFGFPSEVICCTHLTSRYGIHLAMQLQKILLKTAHWFWQKRTAHSLLSESAAALR